MFPATIWSLRHFQCNRPDDGYTHGCFFRANEDNMRRGQRSSLDDRCVVAELHKRGALLHTLGKLAMLGGDFFLRPPVHGRRQQLECLRRHVAAAKCDDLRAM